MATYSSSTTRYETNNGYWITLPAFQKLKRLFWQPVPSISTSLFILFYPTFSVLYLYAIFQFTSKFVAVVILKPCCRWAKGKKTNEYIIFIHPWIFVNFPAEGILFGCV